MAFTNQYLRLLCLTTVLILGQWAFVASSTRSDVNFQDNNEFKISQLDLPLLEEILMRERFEEWMTEHGRVYEDVFEKELRFKIFEQNVKSIEEFNRGSNGKSYTLGVNAFTDLTTEEFQAIYTGKTLEPSISITEKTGFMYENLTRVPVSIDWRHLGAVTDVKNQGSCGCCWAFAVTAAVESLNQIKTRNLISLSDQQILDCNSDNMDCLGGYIHLALNYVLRNGGLTTSANYPYLEYKQNQCALRPGMPQFARITGYESVSGEVRMMIAASQQPIAVHIDFRNLQHYRGGIYTGPCGTQFNHAVTIVGYGRDPATRLDYWLVKNSWGKTWGENGYFRIVRGRNLCGIAYLGYYPTMSTTPIVT